MRMQSQIPAFIGAGTRRVAAGAAAAEAATSEQQQQAYEPPHRPTSPSHYILSSGSSLGERLGMHSCRAARTFPVVPGDAACHASGRRSPSRARRRAPPRELCRPRVPLLLRSRHRSHIVPAAHMLRFLLRLAAPLQAWWTTTSCWGWTTSPARRCALPLSQPPSLALSLCAAPPVASWPPKPIPPSSLYPLRVRPPAGDQGRVPRAGQGVPRGHCGRQRGQPQHVHRERGPGPRGGTGSAAPGRGGGARAAGACRSFPPPQPLFALSQCLAADAE